MPQFASGNATVLHNDVYPGNVGLPYDPGGEAALVDWEMVGWGMAELDLAFMFTQPYRSARQIDRTAALDYYWDQRQRLEGRVPGAEERQARQRHADALWALSLVPRAQEVARSPFPPGSAPADYWDAMYGVLYERLADLCSDLAGEVRKPYD
jgi:aminoglycoside phosphotransferase (APT) family kinase protein